MGSAYQIHWQRSTLASFLQVSHPISFRWPANEMDAQRVHRGSLFDMLESIRAKLMSSSTNVSPEQVLHVVHVLDFAAERLHRLPPDSPSRVGELRQQIVADCMTNLARKLLDAVAQDIRVQSQDEVCPICLEVLQLGCQASMIRACRHKFHAPCMIEWLQYKQSCPRCRTPLSSSAQRLLYASRFKRPEAFDSPTSG